MKARQRIHTPTDDRRRSGCFTGGTGGLWWSDGFRRIRDVQVRWSIETDFTTGWPWWFNTRFRWLQFRSSASLPICHAIFTQFSPTLAELGRQRDKPNQSPRNQVSNHHSHPVDIFQYIPGKSILSRLQGGGWRELVPPLGCRLHWQRHRLIVCAQLASVFHRGQEQRRGSQVLSLRPCIRGRLVVLQVRWRNNFCVLDSKWIFRLAVASNRTSMVNITPIPLTTTTTGV